MRAVRVLRFCADETSLTKRLNRFWQELQRVGCFPNVDQFDAALFRLTPRQAQMLDPQQRLWLECVYQALEDAGVSVSDTGYAGAAANIGVFAGGRESTYLWHLVGGNRDAVDALLHRSNDEAHQLMISNDTDSHRDTHVVS